MNKIVDIITFKGSSLNDVTQLRAGGLPTFVTIGKQPFSHDRGGGVNFGSYLHNVINEGSQDNLSF